MPVRPPDDPAYPDKLAQRLFGVDGEVIRRALNAANNLVVITRGEPDHEIVWANRYFYRFTGYTPDEVLGHNCRFLQNRGDGTRDGEQEGRYAVKRAVENGTFVGVLLRNYTKAGQLFWNELFVTPVFDDDGQITHFIGVQNDVTDRVTAEDRIQVLSQKLDSAEQQERDRLGREMHDGLGQVLTGLSLAAGAHSRILEEAGSPHRQTAARLGELAAQAVSESRSIALGLNPVGSKPGGLALALARLAAEVDGDVAVTFEEDGEIEVDMVPAQHLFRIAQEAVSNALRHADASRIHVRLSGGGAEPLVLRIEDDGRGFDPEAPPPASRGLDSMRFRAARLGATFDAQTGEGNGTVIEVRLAPGSAGRPVPDRPAS